MQAHHALDGALEPKIGCGLILFLKLFAVGFFARFCITGNRGGHHGRCEGGDVDDVGGVEIIIAENGLIKHRGFGRHVLLLLSFVYDKIVLNADGVAIFTAFP